MRRSQNIQLNMKKNILIFLWLEALIGKMITFTNQIELKVPKGNHQNYERSSLRAIEDNKFLNFFFFILPLVDVGKCRSKESIEKIREQ